MYPRNTNYFTWYGLQNVHFETWSVHFSHYFLCHNYIRRKGFATFVDESLKWNIARNVSTSTCTSPLCMYRFCKPQYIVFGKLLLHCNTTITWAFKHYNINVSNFSVSPKIIHNFMAHSAVTFVNFYGRNTQGVLMHCISYIQSLISFLQMHE